MHGDERYPDHSGISGTIPGDEVWAEISEGTRQTRRRKGIPSRRNSLETARVKAQAETNSTWFPL